MSRRLIWFRANSQLDQLPGMAPHGSTHNWAWARLPPIHMSLWCSAVAAQQWIKQRTWQIILTFLWLIFFFVLFCFGHRRPSHSLGYLDYARQRASVQPSQGQGSVLSAHSSQTNWTLGVQRASQWEFTLLSLLPLSSCSTIHNSSLKPVLSCIYLLGAITACSLQEFTQAFQYLQAFHPRCNTIQGGSFTSSVRKQSMLPVHPNPPSDS